MSKVAKKKWRYEIITPASEGKWRVLEEFDDDKYWLYADHSRSLVRVEGIWEAQIVQQAGKYKEGDSVIVISERPQKGVIGTIAGFEGAEADMGGLVEKYLVEFPGDNSGPYLIPDHEFEFVA